MTHLMVEGIYWELQDSPLENIQQYPEYLQPLIECQNRIGWDQLFKGRLSILWRQIHLKYLKDNNRTITRNNSGIGWLTNLIRLIFSHVHGVWKHQNLDKHGETLAEQTEKKRLLCASEIATYYEYRDNEELTDDFPNHIFYSSFQEHMQKESAFVELDNWRGTFKPLILQSKAAKTALDQQTPSANGGCTRSSRASAAL